jgi:hypothetical protein
MLRTRCLLAVAALATSGAVAVLAAPAASASTPSGTILYDKGGNVYATVPDGTATRQVTTDGATPAADKTGSTGYQVPTESADGTVVVAVRNQVLTSSSDQQNYLRGYLWVMNAYGGIIRKIDPPQFAYLGGTTCGLPANNPRGIVNAQVSPDGAHIAYTALELFEGSFDCTAHSSYITYIVNIDGTGATLVRDNANNEVDLEIGSWADSATLLVDRGDFGSVEDYYVHVPGSTGAPWFGPSSFTDAAYAQPALRSGILATDGYSDTALANVVRLWTSSGFTSQPVARCDFTSTADAANDWLADPSLAPDGSAVAYQDTNPDGTISKAGQGIYVLTTSGITTGCGATPQLLVAGGSDAFWSPAGLNPPPNVVISAHPADPSNQSSASFSFSVYSSGPPPGVTCSLDGAAATACTSPTSYSGLADGVHTFTVTAGSSTASYSWRIDTTRPSVAMTAPTATVVLTSSVADAWTGSDTGSGIRSFQQQLRVAAYSGSFGSWSNLGSARSATDPRTSTVSPLSAGYQYCLRVRATDNAGNLNYSSPRCVTVPLDDRSLSPSSGWVRATGSTYYHGTITYTKALGARLTRSGGVSITHVGVVATACSTCGTVAVYIGSTLIGKISLYASTTHYKVIKVLGTSSRSGTVTVKVLTSGKLVAIDGLVVSH